MSGQRSNGTSERCGNRMSDRCGNRTIDRRSHSTSSEIGKSDDDMHASLAAPARRR